jgi:CRISPR type IV-associated protein Csf1
LKLNYFTRDAKGNDFTKIVEIKEFPIEAVETECSICHKKVEQAIMTKKAVSANFTDWNYVGDYICPKCARLLSLFKYSYIVEGEDIQLLNVRQIKEMLLRQHKTPNLMIITTSQKKHLFYKAERNYTDDVFAVNLETETIYTSRERMKILFAFVENLLTLGVSKQGLKEQKIPYAVVEKLGIATATQVINYLAAELTKSREIQIPLFCGQKLEIEEEDALCNINLILQA